MAKQGNNHGGIPTPDKKHIFPLGADYYPGKKNPTDSSANSLRTETISMHKKITARHKSKYKESSPSYISFESSRVSTDVDYTTTIDPNPTP